MDIDTAKRAFLRESPVIFRGERYRRISGLVYRVRNNRVCVTLEIEDMPTGGKSVVIADPEKVDLAEGPDPGK